MAEWDSVSLPPRHVFLTLAHRQRQRTLVLPGWLVGLALALCAVAAIWMVGCTIYVVGHDSLLAGLMQRQHDMQAGYEDRIAVLRRDLERSASQRALLERSVVARLDALSAAEADLRRNAGVFADLAQTLHHGPDHAADHADIVNPAREAAPEPDQLQKQGSLEGLPRRVGERLTQLSTAYDALASAQAGGLASMQTAASAQLARYRAAFDSVGLSASRFASAEGTGGPFVPLDTAHEASAFEHASLSLRATLIEAERLRAVASRVPFNEPLEGVTEVTSPFGARVDPFLGRPALHTGVDLRGEEGAAVRATAGGRIAFAGPASGYGVMVEIDHGHGLVTRYAHLSAVDVSVGETVTRDDVVGRVGSTGRATGPHLHYETRIDGEPVDPERFLAAGQRLATLEHHS